MMRCFNLNKFKIFPQINYINYIQKMLLGAILFILENTASVSKFRLATPTYFLLPFVHIELIFNQINLMYNGYLRGNP